MSIWTSKPRRRIPLWVGMFALALSGCVGLGGGLQEIAVTTDAVVVTGPSGFCVDESGTTDRGTTAFVLMGNCQAVAESRLASSPDAPAILTAAISEPGTPGDIAASIPGLTEFFASSDGLQVLSRSGDAETVEVLQSFAEGDVFYINASDTSPGAVPGVRDDYWRAYLDIGDRIATLSVLALQDSSLEDTGTRVILRDFVAAVRAANPAPGEAPTEGTGLFANGPLGGLFGGRS